jgi:type IV secretory pathway TraG/TraD family ATPase VirD4
MPQAFHNQTVPGQQEHDALIQFMWLGLIGACLIIAVLMHYFGFRRPQIIEMYLVICFVFYIAMDSLKTALKRKTVFANLWPKPRCLISEDYDRKCMAIAAKRSSTLLGYEDNGDPVYWSDGQRAMQTNMPGVSGSGKTTAILNILMQDILRGKPVVFADGKGSKDIISKLIVAAMSAGRINDLRVIDPSNPETSSKYNPFYLGKDELSQRVGIIFDSLGASQSKEEFFAEHQWAFLDSLCNILSRTGKTLTFQSVLAAAQRPDIVRETILSVRSSVVNDQGLKQHVKDGFALDADNLEGVYSEEQWRTKIQGLLNSMKPFVGSALAQITEATENLVTIEDVIEKKLILLVSMNVGENSKPNQALGRIIVRDVQAQIAKRYNDYKLNKQHEFISIVLDEFGMFAYGGFAKIINTAREAKAGFLFSFQNVSQLAGEVGQSFADDVASSTNCKFIMRISNEDTAEQFISASGSVRTERVSYAVEKQTKIEGIGGYEEVGRGTRQEMIESRVRDEQLKNLPTGQMMAIFPNTRMGIVVKHIHVRRPIEYFLHDLFAPPWFQDYRNPDAEQNKLHISLGARDNSKGSKNGRRSRKS